jgi:hypothetical protein
VPWQLLLQHCEQLYARLVLLLLVVAPAAAVCQLMAVWAMALSTMPPAGVPLGRMLLLLLMRMVLVLLVVLVLVLLQQPPAPGQW